MSSSRSIDSKHRHIKLELSDFSLRLFPLNPLAQQSTSRTNDLFFDMEMSSDESSDESPMASPRVESSRVCDNIFNRRIVRLKKN